MRRAILGTCLLTIAVLAQGCLLGRSLYYSEEQPSTDELRSNPSSSDADGGPGDASADRAAKTGANTAEPPVPPPPPTLTPPATGTDTCSAIAVACVKGGGIEYCVSYSANACSKITYKHDGKTYECSCAGTDCTNAYYGAYTSCQDAAGSCDQLATCCKNASPDFQNQCQETLKTYVGQPYGDVACKSIVTSYRSSKLCP